MDNSFTEALTSYVAKYNEGKVRRADEENRVGLFEYVQKLNWRPNYRQKMYVVCIATQAVNNSLEKHIDDIKSFTSYDEACKYYLEACKKTACIWGRDKASA